MQCIRTGKQGHLTGYQVAGCRCDDCKSTHSEYNRKRRAANARVVDAFKDIPCMDCGQTFPTVCMDFDHRNPEDKSFAIAAGKGNRSLESLIAEIDKCDVVCSNCHRIRTWLK